MNVDIVEKKTGRVVTTIRVVLGGMNFTSAHRDCEAKAWECAVIELPPES